MIAPEGPSDVPVWAQALLALVAAVGGLAGVVGLYTARATRRNLDADTTVKLVEASGAVVEQIRKERSDLIRHKEDCEERLAELERKVRDHLKAP